MSANPPLPRLFGPYVLTRALGTDPLGRTYRAGTSSGKQLRPFLLVRVFDGEAVDRAALLPAMESAVEYLEEVKGPAVAKGMVLGIVDDLPFAGMEYVPGRTLDQVIGGGAGHPVPIPPEHALLITEKILAALEASKPMARGTGAPHGFLVPAFVAVSNDGDTRVFGGGLGRGLLPSLKGAAASAAFASYIAPEVAASGKPSAAGDLYSTGVILLEALTGQRPAPGAAGDGAERAVLAVNGNPLPEDVKRMIQRLVARDPGRRESDVASFRKDLGKLLYGGPYAPSTFNLAFFMHQQFEKGIETERREMNAEEQLDVRTLQQAEDAAQRPAAPAAQPTAARPAAPPRDVTVPSFGVGRETAASITPGGAKKPGLGGVPVFVVAGIVLVLGAGAFFLARGTKRAAVVPTPAAVPTAAPTAPLPTPTPVLVGKEDPEFQAALQAKLQEEEKKLQERMQKESETAAKKRQAELDKAAGEARKAKEADEAARAARDRADQEEATRLAREAAEARQREDAARQAAAAAVPKTKEGDLVDVSQVDTPPVTRKIVKPEPSPMSLQRHVSGTVMMRVLVNENGKAEKIDILRDTSPKVGLGDSCRRALNGWEWSPAMKDGKRVKTWIVVPIPFKGL